MPLGKIKQSKSTGKKVKDVRKFGKINGVRIKRRKTSLKQGFRSSSGPNFRSHVWFLTEAYKAH